MTHSSHRACARAGLAMVTQPAVSLPRCASQVNNQMVVGTLMNICDSPNLVSVYQGWREGDWNRRVPIIVTGNDFSKVFAPLVREGRMAKFYWKPEREELVAILHQMYKVGTQPHTAFLDHQPVQYALNRMISDL